MSFVLVVIGISIYQERKTEHALAALRDLSSPRALVIRDGERVRVAGRDVVRGDVVLLAEATGYPPTPSDRQRKPVRRRVRADGESVPVHQNGFGAGRRDDGPPARPPAVILSANGPGWGAVQQVEFKTGVGGAALIRAGAAARINRSSGSSRCSNWPPPRSWSSRTG
jgi:hypothetical protein